MRQPLELRASLRLTRPVPLQWRTIMKAWSAIGLAMLAGAVLGGAAAQRLHAQATPPVSLSAIHDVRGLERRAGRRDGARAGGVRCPNEAGEGDLWCRGLGLRWPSLRSVVPAMACLARGSTEPTRIPKSVAGAATGAVPAVGWERRCAC